MMAFSGNTTFSKFTFLHRQQQKVHSLLHYKLQRNAMHTNFFFVISSQYILLKYNYASDDNDDIMTIDNILNNRHYYQKNKTIMLDMIMLLVSTT